MATGLNLQDKPVLVATNAAVVLGCTLQAAALYSGSDAPAYYQGHEARPWPTGNTVEN